MITQKGLKEVLHYDPETGVFTWRVKRGKIRVGDVAGCKNASGYQEIMIDRTNYSGHRLAWLYVYGYFPEHGIDHKDRIKHHNWIDNLREASNQCNLRNTGNFSHNTSGVKGVYWNKRNNNWNSRIYINGKTHSLGAFKSFSEAVCHRLAAEQCLGWQDCWNHSPAYRYIQEHLIRRDQIV